MGRPVNWGVRLRMACLCLALVPLFIITLAVELVLFWFVFALAWIVVVAMINVAINVVAMGIGLFTLLLFDTIVFDGVTFSSTVFLLGIPLGPIAFSGMIAVTTWEAFTQPDVSVLFPTTAETNEEARLEAYVNRLAQQAAIPSPDVAVAETGSPLVLSSGLRPATSTILVSRETVSMLDDDELEAVLAHEIAHIANRDTAVMTAAALPKRVLGVSPTSITPILFVMIPNRIFETTIRLLISALGRTREYAADDGAVELTGSPAALASALQTLDESMAQQPQSDLRTELPTAASSIVPAPRPPSAWRIHYRLTATHPPTKKRIDRLRSIANQPL